MSALTTQWDDHRVYLQWLQNVEVTQADGTVVSLSFDTDALEFVDPNGDTFELSQGDVVTYDDVQLAHFYHNGQRPGNDASRIDGFTELLIQGNFKPVNLTQLQGLDGRIEGRVAAGETEAFIVDMVSWSGPSPVTREALTTFYREQYQAALGAGIIEGEIDVNRFAERACSYVFDFSHSALLNLAGGGALPHGTELPLLHWHHKPG